MNHLETLTKTAGKMKLIGSKKGKTGKGLISLRDYCDFAKMVFTVPS